MLMIQYTTPTIPIRVRGGNILASNVRVTFTFAQNRRRVDVAPDSMEATEDGVLCEVSLTQLQTGGFHAGRVDVQVNAVDSNDFRAASPFKSVYIGSNLLPKVVNYDN